MLPCSMGGSNFILSTLVFTFIVFNRVLEVREGWKIWSSAAVLMGVVLITVALIAEGHNNYPFFSSNPRQVCLV